LFIPRKLSGEDSRWADWNKMQPIVDNVQINQYTHDGKKTGIWEEYWNNGNLYSKGSYKNGIKEGYWEYYKDGQLDSKGSFKNGEWDGIWECYYSNGQLESKGSYKNGLRYGIWEEYYINGNLEFKGLYKNDELVKKLPLTESEEPKKGKLFVPRNIDERAKEYEGIIKQRLEKIRNSPFGKLSKEYIFEWIQENNLDQDFKTSFKSPPLGSVVMTSYNISTGEVILFFDDEGNNNVAIKFKIKDIQIGTIDINPDRDDKFYPMD
jgi:hypothetical protein